MDKNKRESVESAASRGAAAEPIESAKQESGAASGHPRASNDVVEVEGEIEWEPQPEAQKQQELTAITERAIVEIEPTALADLATEEQIEKAIRRIVARTGAIKRFRAAMLSLTNRRDWYAHEAEGEEVGIPYLGESGAEKIINAFQIEVWHDGGKREVVDEGGYEFVYQGQMRALVFSDLWYPVIGSRWSDDGFFTRGGTKTADPGDVRKAAWTNWMNRGIKTVCGLRTITWEELEQLPGLENLRNTVKKISYGSKKGSGPAPAPGELSDIEKGAHIKVKIDKEDLDSRNTIKSIPQAERLWNKSPGCFYWVVKWSKKNFGTIMDMRAANATVVFKLYDIPKEEMP
jgi:hypothetical protein